MVGAVGLRFGVDMMWTCLCVDVMLQRPRLHHNPTGNLGFFLPVELQQSTLPVYVCKLQRQ